MTVQLRPSPSVSEDVPVLDFRVVGAGALAHAAGPTLRFDLRIDAGAAEVRSLSLNAQIGIEAARRGYDDDAQERLRDLFGAPSEWDRSLRTLHWTQASVVVPGFAGATRFELRVPCTYDFDVAAAKYLHAVRDGEIPLRLQFSGSLFYAASDGALRAARLPWDREAEWMLPAAVWHELMDRYFPRSAWLRVHRDVFDRLDAWRMRHGLSSWDAALDELLRERES